VVRNASFAGSPSHEAEDHLGAPGVHERQLMRSRGLIWKNEYAVRIVMNVTDTISLDQKQLKKEGDIYTSAYPVAIMRGGDDENNETRRRQEMKNLMRNA
jgi:hypothetical protein